jgi:hypothetical protein
MNLLEQMTGLAKKLETITESSTKDKKCKTCDKSCTKTYCSKACKEKVNESVNSSDNDKDIFYRGRLIGFAWINSHGEWEVEEHKNGMSWAVESFEDCLRAVADVYRIEVNQLIVKDSTSTVSESKEKKEDICNGRGCNQKAIHNIGAMNGYKGGNFCSKCYTKRQKVKESKENCDHIYEWLKNYVYEKAICTKCKNIISNSECQEKYNMCPVCREQGTCECIPEYFKVYNPETKQLENYDTISEAWDTKMNTDKKDKGMFKNKTKAELKSELEKLKKNPNKSAAHKKKEKQLMFALRAKNKFGKINENVNYPLDSEKVKAVANGRDFWSDEEQLIVAREILKLRQQLAKCRLGLR